MKSKKDIFTAAVLGSDVIRAVAATFEDPRVASSGIQILGYSAVSSRKIRRDEPLAPEIVAEELSQAMRECWEQTGSGEPPCVQSLIISGDYIYTRSLKAEIELDEEQPVSFQDHEAVLHQASVIAENTDFAGVGEIILPCALMTKGFRLDDGPLLFNATGRTGAKLSSESLYFIADRTTIECVARIAQDALPPQCSFSQMVYAPVALYGAIFPPTQIDEPQGLVIDLGAGMTTYAIPFKWGFLSCGQIPVGVDHAANDLSIALGLRFETGRDILRGMEELRCSLDVKRDGTIRRLSIKEGSEGTTLVCGSAVEMIVAVRFEELFQLVKQRLEEEGASAWLGNEILLTGVGATLPQITMLAEKVFPGRRVRVATPYGVRPLPGQTLNPADAILLGGLRTGAKEHQLQIQNQVKDMGFLGKVKSFWDSLRDW